MSQQVRGSNLFAAEQWDTVYKSFKDVDFRAYDFDSLKQSLIEYIKAYYPEDFNDYIESSEYIALIELMAWLGTSLAFRVDLNSRENFLDTAERRDSIIRLARMINYQPKRNIGAKGLFKIVGVETTQPLVDSFGRSLQNTTVFWNDPNNPDSFDQFVQIMNNVYIPSNPFGRPVKDGTIGGIKTSLYQMNDVTGINVAHKLNITVNNEQMAFEIVNPDFNDGESIFERPPNPENAMHVVYRNDGQGFSSENTGFFFHFKQGTLVRQDERFDFPKQNRVVDIDFENVNNSDVWVQEIDQDGIVQEQWTNVPAVAGSNIAYNDIVQSERTIYSVISGLNDSIQIKYPDGNLGQVPTGIFRTWARTSINKSFIMRTDDASGLEMSFPYVGVDNQTYQVRFLFQLETNISNSAPSETNEEIKERAPRAYYSQDRMVNSQDYNVFPLTFGNQVSKLSTINRTHAGHSRFIDINDPTGVYSKVILFGEDGNIFLDDEPTTIDLDIDDTSDIFNLVAVNLQNFISESQELQNWFYDYLVTEYRAKSAQGFDVFNVPRGRAETVPPSTYFKTKAERYKNDTGYFTTDKIDSASGAVGIGTVPTSENDSAPYEFLKEGSYMFTEDGTSCVLSNVRGIGLPSLSTFETVGPVELTNEVVDLQPVMSLLPAFRTIFTDDEILNIANRMDERKDFVISYDINDGGKWKTFATNYGADGVLESPATPEDLYTLYNNEEFTLNSPLSDARSWTLFMTYNQNSGDIFPSYTVKMRGIRYIFESVEEVRFFYDPDENIIDPETGKALRDEIVILRGVNYNNGEPIEENVVFNIDKVFIYEDGHQDQRKISIVPEDPDLDGVLDNPVAFREIVGSVYNTDTSGGTLNLNNIIMSKSYIDVDTYEYFKPYYGAVLDLRGGFSTHGTDILTDSDMVIIGAGDLPNFQNYLNDPSLVDDETREAVNGLVVYEEPYLGERLIPNKGFYINDNTGSSGRYASFNSTKIFKIYNGKTANQNTFETDGEIHDPLYFKWKHYSPSENRIDPSVSNIMDMTLLTSSYLEEVTAWKDENRALIYLPQPPSTEELRIQFNELNQYKMLSDQIVFRSGKFKILFGDQALPELQASFKVVKIPTTLMNDNEIKTGIIAAIDEFFAIDNWDFGESFFFTELAAYIHQQLSSAVSTVVIVPTKEDSQFGNLFQIKAEPTELFLSTANVTDIEIVENLTETNLRV